MWQRNNKVSRRRREERFENLCKSNTNKDEPREERRRRKVEEKPNYLPSFLLAPVNEAPSKPGTTVSQSILLNHTKVEKPPPKYDTNNPKLWKNGRWQGPVIMRSKNNKIINKGAVTQYIRSNIEFSRDEEAWHNSWESTFTPDEWNRMQEIEDAEESEHMKMVFKHSFNKRLEESQRYYAQEGDLDDFAIVMQEDEAYERYLQRLEQESEEESEEEDYFDDIV